MGDSRNGLRVRWAAHQARPFHAEVESDQIDGVDLALPDTDAAAHLNIFTRGCQWVNVERWESLDGSP